MEQRQQDAGNAFYLRGKLDLAADGPLRAELLQALGAGDELTIHLEQSTPLDFALLQLLCAAHRSAHRRGTMLRLARPLREEDRLALQRMGDIDTGACPAGVCPWAPTPS